MSAASAEQTWAWLHAARLVAADLLEALPDDRWDEPSLCDGWRVREVAAHLSFATRAGPLAVVRGVIRARGSLNWE